MTDLPRGRCPAARRFDNTPAEQLRPGEYAFHLGPRVWVLCDPRGNLHTVEGKLVVEWSNGHISVAKELRGKGYVGVLEQGAWREI